MPPLKIVPAYTAVRSLSMAGWEINLETKGITLRCGRTLRLVPYVLNPDRDEQSVENARVIEYLSEIRSKNK